MKMARIVTVTNKETGEVLFEGYLESCSISGNNNCNRKYFNLQGRILNQVNPGPLPFVKVTGPMRTFRADALRLWENISIEESKSTEKSGIACIHVWKDYTGIMEQYKYCELCGKKNK